MYLNILISKMQSPKHRKFATDNFYCIFGYEKMIGYLTDILSSYKYIKVFYFYLYSTTDLRTFTFVRSSRSKNFLVSLITTFLSPSNAIRFGMIINALVISAINQIGSSVRNGAVAIAMIYTILKILMLPVFPVRYRIHLSP